MRIQKINGIGNMISIEDQKNAILDAMERCTEGSDVWNTYAAVLTMLTSVSCEYDINMEAELAAEELIHKVFSKN